MGVYDRDYMKETKPRRMDPPPARPYEPPPAGRAPLWARIKFRLWLLFNRRR